MTRFALATLAAGLLALAGCASAPRDTASRIVISIPQQKLVLFRNGELVAEYPVSTSKFGLGDKPGSYATPVGRMRVAQKIGHGQPMGAVFKSRKPTGEILPPNAPGRDPIVTRILWLEGLDAGTRNAFSRLIYIHGTTEEKNIGKPVSFGCIRMTSAGVLDLFNRVGVGAEVVVTEKKVESFVRAAARERAALASAGRAQAAVEEKPVEPDAAPAAPPAEPPLSSSSPARANPPAPASPRPGQASQADREDRNRPGFLRRVALLSEGGASGAESGAEAGEGSARRRFPALPW